MSRKYEISNYMQLMIWFFLSQSNVIWNLPMGKNEIKIIFFEQTKKRTKKQRNRETKTQTNIQTNRSWKLSVGTEQSANGLLAIYHNEMWTLGALKNINIA